MKKSIVALALLASMAWSESMENSNEQEAIEIGGSVAFDVAADLEDIRGASVDLGTVDLFAVVNIAPSLKALIKLSADDNLSKVAVNQALIEWKPDGKIIDVVLGKHTLNNGLLATHLISDPLVVDYVEVKQPGATVNFTLGPVVPGLGFAAKHNDEVVEQRYSIDDNQNVIVEDVVVSEESYEYIGVFNIDANFLESNKARFSMAFQEDIMNLSLGTDFTFGPATLDLEIHSEVMDKVDEMMGSGYYTGLALGVSDLVELAVRYDGLSEDSFKELRHRIGAGSTFSFKHGIFAALEYSYDKEYDVDGKHEIALSFGLESTLKLPGFQRRTLVNPNNQ